MAKYTDILVPRTHRKVDIPYIIGNKKIETTDEVKKYIQEELNNSLETIIMEIEIWINNKVAFDTGALRESLIEFLNKSKPPISTIGELRGIRLVLGVGADIDYAKYVNEMTTSTVRHAKDPRAIGFYHDHMVEYGIERFDINIDKAIMKINE